MNKTIASRFFSATSLLIVISIGLLGVTFMIFANKYFESDRLNILNLCVTSAVDTLDMEYDKEVAKVVNKTALRDKLRLISATTQATVFVADDSGKVVVCTDSADSCIHQKQKLPQEALDKTSEATGVVRVSDIFAKAYQENSYTVGVTMHSETGEVTGYVFASSDASSITIFTNALLSIFMLSAGVMILISSIVSLAVTSKMTTPLTNISDAAKRFSQGDFSARAIVEGDDEVAHLAYTFNNMATFAENNETSRSNFVTNIAHELRTPMTSIKGFVDGIID
ncbi:MAG: HAMP domain-containing protein, partial [Oscillospiraceae bacterium]